MKLYACIGIDNNTVNQIDSLVKNRYHYVSMG
jgi:hypothetical protein